MRTTKKELADRNRKLERENTILALALAELARGTKPDAVETARGPDPDESYSWRLYRSDSSYGGIVVQTFYYNGQTPHVTAHYLDELCSSARGASVLSLPEYLEHRCALERLRNKRNALLTQSA